MWFARWSFITYIRTDRQTLPQYAFALFTSQQITREMVLYFIFVIGHSILRNQSKIFKNLQKWQSVFSAMNETPCSHLFVARPPSQGLGFETVALLGCTAHKISLSSSRMRVDAVVWRREGSKLGNLFRPPGFERKQIWNPSQVKTHTATASSGSPPQQHIRQSFVFWQENIHRLPVSEMEKEWWGSFCCQTLRGNRVPSMLVQFNPSYSEIHTFKNIPRQN